MIAYNKSEFKPEELFIAGVGYFSFGFYIIFSNVIRSVINLFINGEVSRFYFFGSYCFSGDRLMDISELPLNEKSVLVHGLFMAAKIGLVVGSMFWFNKARHNLVYIVVPILVFSLVTIDAVSLLVYFVDKFLNTYFFWYFFSSAPFYLLSKQLGLSIAIPVLLASLGIGLPVYVLKRLGLYSFRTLVVSVASMFSGIISVVLVFKILREVIGLLA